MSDTDDRTAFGRGRIREVGRKFEREYAVHYGDEGELSQGLISVTVERDWMVFDWFRCSVLVSDELAERLAAQSEPIDDECVNVIARGLLDGLRDAVDGWRRMRQGDASNH